MAKTVPLVAGQKFNHLTVIKLDHVEDRIYGSKYVKSGKSAKKDKSFTTLPILTPEKSAFLITTLIIKYYLIIKHISSLCLNCIIDKCVTINCWMHTIRIKFACIQVSVCILKNLSDINNPFKSFNYPRI